MYSENFKFQNENGVLGAGILWCIIHYQWFWIVIAIAMALWIERVLLHFYVNNKNEKSTTRKHIETYAKWNRFSTVCSFVSPYEEKIKLNASTKLNALNCKCLRMNRCFGCVFVFCYCFVLLSFSFRFSVGMVNEKKNQRHWLLTTDYGNGAI